MAKPNELSDETIDGWEAMPNSRYFITAVIDHFEKNQAVIKTDDGQELLWPIENLPDGATEGGVIRLIISASSSDTEERTALAKALLNQILKPEAEAKNAD